MRQGSSCCWSNIKRRKRSTDRCSAVDAVVQGRTGDGVASAVEELGLHHKGSLVKNQEIVDRNLVAYEVIGKLYPRNKLVVLVVRCRGVGSSLNRHAGRARHRIGRAAVDLNSNGKSGTRA